MINRIANTPRRALALLMLVSPGLFAGCDPQSARDEQQLRRAQELAGGWLSQSVGAPAIEGGATPSNGGADLDVTGAGKDIWGTADQFRFVFQPTTGNTATQTRAQAVFSPDGGFGPGAHPWAKAGVMIRESLDPQSPYVALLNTAQRGLRIQYRRSSGARARDVVINDGREPLGPSAFNLRIERWGDTFSFYRTDAIVFGDGQNEVFLGNVSVAMDEEALAGVAVTSHREDEAVTYSFAGLDTGVTTVETLADVNQPPTGFSGDAVYLDESAEPEPVVFRLLDSVNDPDSLTVFIKDVDPLLGKTGPEQEGTIEIVDDAVVYTPNADTYFDSFSVIISDGINEQAADFFVYRL